MQDNFTFQYYSGTNKLSRVSGNVDQFRYDLNGNVITDSVYNNFSISYDYRNLITELYHIDTLTSTRHYSYATRYWYDEAGSRVRKLTYRNAQIPPPQINDWANPGNGWTLLNNEHYVRGVDGKELAIYTGNTINEWYVWASDMVGKIKGSAKYFYFKDHLGSVRAVVDNNFNLISAVDGACPRVLLAGDMWGDKMQGRIYNGDSTKFGFTGKEEDEESYYDYFGARYYDSRIGRWGSVDPLFEKYYNFSPYNYVLDNPLIFYDPNGKDPRRDQMGSLDDVINTLESNVGKSIYEIGLDVFGNTGQYTRYIYTEERGILDLQHVFAAAHQSAKWGFEPALNRGLTKELMQSISIGDKKSAFNPEDLPSNLQGAILGKLLDSYELTNENINIITEFLKALKVISPNDERISQENVYIPTAEDVSLGIILPRRYSYSPYYGETPDYINQIK